MRRRTCAPGPNYSVGRLEVNGRPLTRSEWPAMASTAQYVMYDAKDVVCAEVSVIDQADGRIIERRGDVLVIRATNGTYRYRLSPCTDGRTGYLCAERLRE